MALFNPEKQTEKTLLKKVEQMQKEPPVLSFKGIVFGAVGWQVCIPVVIGAFGGKYLDKHFPFDGISWTLNGLFLGFIFGLICAWFWIKNEEKKIYTETSQKTENEVYK